MKFINEEEFANKSGIYSIVQISTGKRYIGQTRMPFKKRYWHHQWKLNKNQHDNKHIQAVWNKYGNEDFEFQIIYTVDKINIEELNELEIKYISEYDTYKNGFNMTVGGEGAKGRPISEEAKKIVGEKNRIHNLGKKLSDKTRAKMRKSSPRRKLTKEQHEYLMQFRLGTHHSDEAKSKMREAKIGSKNVRSKINEQIAFEIKTKLINGEKQSDIAEDLGILRGVVHSIVRNDVWTHVEVNGWDEFLVNHSKNKYKYLTEDDVLKIRELLNQNYTATEISKILNIAINVVYGIKANRTYKNIK